MTDRKDFLTFSVQKPSMIKIRGGFSERSGIQYFNTEMQTKEFDDRTRMAIRNTLYRILNYFFEDEEFSYKLAGYYDSASVEFCKDIMENVFICEIGDYYDWKVVFQNDVTAVIKEAPYNEVLDLLEYVFKWLVGNYDPSGYPERKPEFVYKTMNGVFESEYVGYRFLKGEIIPITDKIEIKEIESAFSIKYKGTKSHMQKALSFLSDRDKPDYKNSIKESISAVESICQIITENNKASLGDALKQLEKKGLKLHPALRGAYEKLYGYTSDEGGIRHAEGMFESNVTFEEAKYMLVSCCAFVNYLLAEYGK